MHHIYDFSDECNYMTPDTIIIYIAYLIHWLLVFVLFLLILVNHL